MLTSLFLALNIIGNFLACPVPEIAQCSIIPVYCFNYTENLF